MSFYSKPELLNRDAFKNKRIAPLADFRFTTNTNSLYVAGAEFNDLCKEYAVVFTEAAGGKVVPVCMLGLRDKENLFVDPDTGQWKARYVPAFVRRYPFVLAEMGNDQMGVCIDTDYSGLGEKEGEALFDDAGKNTEFLQNALDFLNRYQVEYMRTQTFCDRLKAHGLLMEMNAKADLADGTSYVVNGLMVVDERKMLQMPQEQAMQLFRSGELSWIYSHLVSLTNFNGLIDLLSKHRQATGEANTAAVAS